MNLFPIVKCALRMCQFIIFFPLFMGIYFWWVSDGSMPYQFFLGMGACFSWLITLMLPQQMMTSSNWGNPIEFWYTLPFSPAQIFLTHFWVQQVAFLVALFLNMGIVWLLGLAPWGGEPLMAVINSATCGIAASIVVQRFCQPREVVFSVRRIIALLMVVAFGGGTIMTAVFSTPYVGPLPTCIALAVGLPCYFLLKKSIGMIEPLTGKEPLFVPEVYCEPKLFDTPKNINANRSTTPAAKPRSNTTEDGVIQHKFYRHFSPMSRYIVMTSWLRWFCLAAFLCGSGFVCMATFSPYKDLKTFTALGIFIGVYGGAMMVHLNRTMIVALNPLPIGARRLFCWLFGPWLAMIVFFIVLAYVVSSHDTVMNCGYYQNGSFWVQGFTGPSVSPRNLIAGETYYGKGLHIPFGTQETDLATENAKRSHDAETLAVAKYFSDLLWVYYGVAARPEELISYDNDGKSWSVSGMPFYRQCREAKLRIGLLNSLAILPAFLLGIFLGSSFNTKGISFDRGPLQRATIDRTSSPKSSRIFGMLKRLRGLLTRIVFFVVITFFSISMFPNANNPLTSYLYPRLFLATHFTSCLIVLILSIPLLYWLSLRAMRRIVS